MTKKNKQKLSFHEAIEMGEYQPEFLNAYLESDRERMYFEYSKKQ